MRNIPDPGFAEWITSGYLQKSHPGGVFYDPVTAITAGAGLAGSLISADAAGDAADTQAGATRDAAAGEQARFDKNVELQEPWRQAGLGALSQLTSGAAPGGDFSRNFGMADYRADPGYQFRLDQGMRGVENSAAARGGLLSGGALKSLNAYNSGQASQEYGNAYNRFNADMDRRFNRLSSLAGTGQTATRDVANMGTQLAQNQGNYMTQGANARASGYVGTANAANSGLSSLVNQYQTPYYNQNNFAGGYGSGWSYGEE